MAENRSYSVAMAKLYILYMKAFLRNNESFLKRIAGYETIDIFFSKRTNFHTLFQNDDTMDINSIRKKGKNMYSAFHLLTASQIPTLNSFKEILNIELSYSLFNEKMKTLPDDLLQAVNEELKRLPIEQNEQKGELEIFIQTKLHKKPANLPQTTLTKDILFGSLIKNNLPIAPAPESEFSDARNKEYVEGNWRGTGEELKLFEYPKGYSQPRYKIKVNFNIMVEGDNISVVGKMNSFDHETGEKKHSNIEFKAEGKLLKEGEHGLLTFTVHQEKFDAYGVVSARFPGIDTADWCVIPFRAKESERALVRLELYRYSRKHANPLRYNIRSMTTLEAD